MVKRQYKHKTGIFGADAEAYCSRLFKMALNPQGSKRPDLVSINGSLKPRLSIELKSGRKMKGVLIDYQLHYAVTTWDDYVNIFGERPLRRKDFLPGIEYPELLLRRGNVAYYYNILNRVDELTAEDLDRPFSRTRIHWGDHFVVPGEYARTAFAVSRHMRTQESMEDINKEIAETIKEDVLKGSRNYDKRKGHPQSWQDIHSRDISAIFMDDESLATKDGKRRIELMRRHYPQLADLQRVQIPGPNGTNVYVLAERKHLRLFDEQFRTIVDERRPILEDIAVEREEAEGLLEKVRVTSSSGLFADGVDHGHRLVSDLTREDVEKLKRLVLWMGEGEKPWDILPEKPKDDIPF